MFCKIGLLFCFLFIGAVYGDGKIATPTVLYSKQSPFGLIEVVTTWDPGVLNICENKDYSLTHSIIIQGDTTYLGAAYEPFATASFCFVKNVENVLLLGLGGGEFLSYLINYFSSAHVDTVDINPAMIEIVKKFRKIDTGNLVKFICKDAFKHVANIKNYYDLIYCDIYFFKPSMIKEYENFFERVNSRLNEGGVFIWNAYIPFIPRIVVEDMFKNFKNVTATILNEGLSIVFICYQGPEKTKENLEKIANDMQAQYNFRYSLPDLLKKFVFISSVEREAWIAKFPILT